jgi:hypothetical protein
VNDAIAIALEGRPERRVRLGPQATAALS